MVKFRYHHSSGICRKARSADHSIVILSRKNKIKEYFIILRIGNLFNASCPTRYLHHHSEKQNNLKICTMEV